MKTIYRTFNAFHFPKTETTCFPAVNKSQHRYTIYEPIKLSTAYVYDYLPETFAIHGYMGRWSPEYRNDSGTGETEWGLRLTELHTVCSERGYIPNYAITEHGFSPICPSTSPVIKNAWAPDKTTQAYNAQTYPYVDADTYTQAIYYLRSSLMNATMSVKNGSNFLKGVGWKYSIYHHHPRDYNIYTATDWEVIPPDPNRNWYYDFGFHNYDSYPGGDRPLRYIARNLHDPAGSIRVGDSGTRQWIPLQNTNLPNDKLSWCGWETGPGQKWGALWRYKTTDDLYYKPTGTNCDFVIDGNYTGWNIQLWKFDTFDYQTCQFNYQNTTIQITSSNYNSTTGKTTISIPSVTENPTFLKFSY